MAESKLSYNDIDTYQGIYPTVFKKLDKTDISVVPFQVYKTWTVLSGSSTSSAMPLQGIYTNPDYLPAIGSELTYNDSANIDGSLQSITYYSINHLFYKYKTSPMKTYGPTDLNRTKKYLYQSASILSFPQITIGEGIKPASFTFTGSVVNLASDRYSNIYDISYDTSSFISNCKFYEGFNEGFDISRFPYTIISTGSLTFVPGVLASDGINGNIGHAVQFDSKSLFVIPNSKIPGYYDRDHDYALSFFISASNDGSTKSQMILGKTGTRKPYYIEVLPNKRIRFYIIGSTPDTAINDYSDATKFRRAFVTGTTAVSSSWNHVVCQKSGSYMQIYVNGSLQISTDQPILRVPISPLTESIRFDSPGATHVAGWNLGTINNGYFYNGKLDELRIYNKALTATEIGYLANRSETGSMLQTNVVGNLFSKQGVAVISSANYRYNDLLHSPYTASYKSTKTIHELNILAKADSGDFNMSLNNTLTKDDDITYYGFVSGSGFAPYVTTIGLYNDSGELLAVGKLAQPIRKRSDVDMNFLIRIDLDKDIK